MPSHGGDGAGSALGIGSTIWRWNENRRVYAKSTDGRSLGAPIYRHHWEPHTIEGETSRSWVTGPKWEGAKAPKRGPHPGWCYSEAELDLACWVADHRYQIMEKVRMAEPTQLLEVARALGYPTP